MRKFLVAVFAIIASLQTMSGMMEAACDHHLGRTENQLPFVRLALTPDLCLDNSAVYLLGELGEKNYRANGTYGFFLGNHRFKVGGEWLTQRLKYNFLSGKVFRWVNQGAGGLDYEYVLDCGFFSSLDLSFDYAHAFSQRLSSKDCEDNRTIFRRIAGSSDYHGSVGLTLKPWCNSRLYLSGDYDSVRYNRKFQSSRHISGYGGTAVFNQRWECIDVNLRGEFRRPYSYYEGQINFNNCTSCGIFSIGIFGNHTRGRDHLPSITAFGVQIAADFGSKTCGGYTNTYACASECCSCDPCNCTNRCELIQWVSEPAVYYPLVLAITDQSLSPCVQPTSTTIPDLVIIITSPDDSTLILATAPYFNTNGGPALRYSIGVTSSASGGPFAAVTIDPNTGVITLQADGDETLTITVTGTNNCGTTSQTFTIELITTT